MIEDGVPVNRYWQQRCWDLLVPVFFLAMGLFLLFHPMILSGLALIQTDPGDPRYDNYLLEHGYQWITGNPAHKSFWNAPFFFPAVNTAAYSEILLGSGPAYWCFRALGFLPDTSFQLWMMSMAALNFLSAWLVFRKALGLSTLASVGGAYVFAFAGMRANLLNAPQLLPQCFSMLAVLCLFKLFSDRDAGGRTEIPSRHSPWIALFAVLMVVQWYAGFYLGFFSAFALIVCFVAAMSLGTSRQALWRFVQTDWKALFAASVGAALALSWMAYHYLISQLVFGSRTWSEIGTMLPAFKSWINMGPGNWMYGWVRSYIDFSALPDVPDHRLGVGFVTLAIALAGFVNLWRIPWGRIVVTTFVVVGVCTLAYPGVWSPWQIISQWIPGAGAIRCVTRVGILLLIPLSFGVAWFLGRLKSRTLALVLMVICAFEQTQTTPSYSKLEVRSTVQAIVEKVPATCQAFYYVTDRSNPDKPRPWFERQLDGMWAQILTGIPTVNGFSGHVPPEWWPLWEPLIATKADLTRVRVGLFRWADLHGMSRDAFGLVPVLTTALADPDLDLGRLDLDIGQGETRVFLGDGWGDDEWEGDRSWCWIVGKHATAFIPLQPGADYVMDMVAGPMEAPGKQQSVDVRLNGTAIGQIPMVQGMRTYRVPLHGRLIQDLNKLEFNFAFAVSPSILGKGQDERPLSAAVDRLRFSLAGNSHEQNR
jgi:hypothetical protein